MSRSRGDALLEIPSQLIADVTMYTTKAGGKTIPALPGWGCPCVLSKVEPVTGYDGWPQLTEPLLPGDSRRTGFVFLSSEEAADIFRKAGKFYLWERRFVGEATVVL